jgi:hypothetical protein
MSHLFELVQENPHSPKQEQNMVAWVYFYCYYGRNQDESGPFLRWVIVRLCRQARWVPENLNQLYKYGSTPSLSQLLDGLAAILDRYRVVNLFIDALDESIPRENLLRVLRCLITENRFSKIQLLMTSREYVDISRAMEGVAIPLSLRNKNLKEDIARHIQSAIHSKSKFNKWPRGLLDEVVTALATQSQGMYGVQKR